MGARQGLGGGGSDLAAAPSILLAQTLPRPQATATTDFSTEAPEFADGGQPERLLREAIATAYAAAGLARPPEGRDRARRGRDACRDATAPLSVPARAWETRRWRPSTRG
jgi:hypothetical protein